MSNTRENAEIVERLHSRAEFEDNGGVCDRTMEDVGGLLREAAAALAKAYARIVYLENRLEIFKTWDRKGTEELDSAEKALAAADARIADIETRNAMLPDRLTEKCGDNDDLRDALEEARRALAPFIRLADNVFSDGKNATVADEVTLWCFNDTDITFGDLRRARATLDRIGK